MNHPTSEPTGVIGGGLGGLAAACTLAARGHKIVLFEKNEWLGGKAALLEEEGFRFDMGPTILTIPSVLRRIFAEAGEKLEDHLDLVRLDPQWRCFYEDGSVLDLVEDENAMAEKLDDYSGPGAGQQYRKFMKMSEKLDEISSRFFFWKPVGGIKDTLDLGTTFKLSTLKDLLALRMGRSVASTVRSFAKDERVAQMLDHFTQYVGSAPDASPAVLCGVAHMQTGEGVWYPMGGTRAVAEALVKLGESLGVEFRTGQGVERILSSGGAAVGVETSDGEQVPLAAVVSNSDSVRTSRELLGEELGARLKTDRYKPACSGVVLYLGLRERYEHLLHHNFVFSQDPEEEFEDIYRRGRPAEDPTAYVCAPAVTEPQVAPEGGEALYVLVHTPYLRPGHDWSKMLPGYRQTIVEKLKRVAGMEDLEERIVYEQTLTPQDIHDRYRVLDGAIYGLASHGKFIGAFKPSNRTPVPGLYLAGGSAHPGPGMPMVLMSGWIAGDALDEDSKSVRSSAA